MTRPKQSFNKNDRKKAVLKKRKDKEQRKEERKANSGKGKGLDDLIAYVDAYGNILSAPPDPKHKEEINIEDIKISTSKKEDIDQAVTERSGIITYYDEAKGFGFIQDNETSERIFVHVNNMEDPVRENDKVTFQTERGRKGLNAVMVRRA